MPKNAGKPVAFDKDRMAPWRRDYDPGTLSRMARQEPLPPDMLVKHYTHANLRTVERLKEYREAHPAQPNPAKDEPGVRKGYAIAIKQCTDSRQATIDLDMLMKYRVIHERTAGSIVRKGMVFNNLSDTGIGIVEGHCTCGACAVAHRFRDSLGSGQIDPHIFEILTSIPPYVRELAVADERDRENAIVQAAYAKRILQLRQRDNLIYPSFLAWDTDHAYEWLDGTPQPDVARAFEEAARSNREYALAEERAFSTQYATMTVVYDPYRFNGNGNGVVGLVNDPRVILDALPNELFCVTTDLRKFIDGPGRISRTAMGSVMYANFDQGGHVKGVGGPNGTHALGIMDISTEVLHKVKRHLLEAPESEIVRNLTNNGETILLIYYDKASGRIEFI